MHRVHWAGVGLSTGSGVRMLADRADVVLYGRTKEKADAAARRLGVGGSVAVAALDDLAPRAGDVVVSMLPAPEHPRLLRLSLAAGAHFADTSYADAEVTALARGADTVVLTEAGLDPGLDHLLAAELVAEASAAVPGQARAAFTSYCGGIPAEPNEFRYRFSWAPRGVLTALLSPARCISAGTETVVDRPWEAVSVRHVRGEDFEVYPNRDSVPFIERYALPTAWSLTTFVRGTIRLPGWRSAWEPVFTELQDGDSDRITALAQELAARYPATDADRDRIVLAVSLAVEGADGARWSGENVLDLVGDEGESAMARVVSSVLAIGVRDIIDGALAPGLHHAADEPPTVRRWLDALRDHGIAPVRTRSAKQKEATRT